MNYINNVFTSPITRFYFAANKIDKNIPILQMSAVNILIMAHGLMYMDDHNNTIPFHSPNTTVVTVAPPSRTSWSNLHVEYDLLMAMHTNLQDPKYTDKPFSKIVRESSKESGVIAVIGRHKTHIPKSFSTQTDEIANKLMTFEPNEGEEEDPYYGIWWLDDPDNYTRISSSVGDTPEFLRNSTGLFAAQRPSGFSSGPLNLLAMPEEFHFPRIYDREMYYFSDIVDTLQIAFPGKSINILDYSCSSCVYPDARVVPNADDRQVRRLARGLKYVAESPKSSRKRKRESPKKGGGTRKRRGRFTNSS